MFTTARVFLRRFRTCIEHGCTKKEAYMCGFHNKKYVIKYWKNVLVEIMGKLLRVRVKRSPIPNRNDLVRNAPTWTALNSSGYGGSGDRKQG